MTNLEYYGFQRLEFVDQENFNTGIPYLNGYTCHIFYKCKHGEPLELANLRALLLEKLREEKVKWLLREVKHPDLLDVTWLNEKDGLRAYVPKHKRKS